MGEEELQQFEQLAEIEMDPVPARPVAGRTPVVPQALAPAAPLSETVARLPPMLSSLRPDQVYLGLPTSSDGRLDGAGSGQVFRNFYRDVERISDAAAPRWIELGDAVAAMNEDRAGWDGVGKDVDKQMDRIRALDARTGGRLQQQLGEYLAAEERVKSARANVGGALDDARAAAHDLAAAFHAVEEVKEEDNATTKRLEIFTRDKEVRESVRAIKQIIGLGEKVAGIAGAAMTGNIPGVVGGAVGAVNGVIDAEDVVATDGKLMVLGLELAQIEERRADRRRKGKDELVLAAHARVAAAQHRITAATISLRAAKLDVGAAMTKLSALEKQNAGKGSSTAFSAIKGQSDTTQFLVGVEENVGDASEKEPTSPTQQFGDGTLRALAGELLNAFTRPAMLRAGEIQARLDEDRDVVERRKRTASRQDALESFARWEVVASGMSSWVRGFRGEHAKIVETLQKLVREGVAGAHFDKRRQILGHIASELRVSRE